MRLINFYLILAVCIAFVTTTARAESVADTLKPAPPGTVQLEGWIGQKLDLCLTNRVMAQDIEKLIKPFRDRKESTGGDWRMEYWGKWFTSAALGCAYAPTPERRALLERAASEVIRTQSADGYIGSYDAGHRLVNWNVWCTKYVLLGLIADHDLTGDKAALEAACRVADCLIRELQEGRVKIVDIDVGVLKGIASCSILEPVALLYQRTGEKRYLDLALAIVAQWSTPSKYAPQGLHLVEDALASAPPLKSHAYAIMSCFEGVCELYRATGDPRLLEAVVKFAQSVRKHELLIDGGVSNQELFCEGARIQTETLEQPQETCATVTWMKLCAQLLRLTGDPIWADELEISLDNALLGATTPDGAWWAYHSPLNGERLPSHAQQADVGLSCCIASGPRGLLLTPRWAVMTSRAGPVVNLYAPGTARITLDGGVEVRIVQKTDYPVGNQIAISVEPTRPCRFTLSLRIPAWSRKTFLAVNGQTVSCGCGTFAKLEREWKGGDRVTLELDMRGRAVPAPSGAPQLAVLRGPILLAMDNRLVEPQDGAAHLVTDAEGYVNLKPAETRPAGVWMAMEVPFEIRPYHFFFHRQIRLVMCDFASAGNAWTEQNLYRTWLPQPLFLRQAFVPGTWKLMYPEPRSRPKIPVK